MISRLWFLNDVTYDCGINIIQFLFIITAYFRKILLKTNYETSIMRCDDDDDD